MELTKEFENDVYHNSAGDCWYAWAKSVGTKHNYAYVSNRDLTTWDTCPRISPTCYPTYKTAANGRICVAHHLIAGPYKDPNETSNECTCETQSLFDFGCQCGGD